jgi:C1A family cysteine protease
MSIRRWAYAPFGWCEPEPGKPCGHGMMLVGYDDALGDPRPGLGAFLVQNSFGTNWPPAGADPAPPGMFYLSYGSSSRHRAPPRWRTRST